MGGYGLGLGYAGLGYAGLGYSGLGYAGIGYAAPIAVAKSAPCVNAANIPVPCNGAALIAGRIWKREAEAEPEADPAYLAVGYGLGYSTLGLGYTGLGYAAPLAYSGYAASPLIAGRIWKREAEAEADPAYLAAGYGLGYAGLGYAGLGYAGLGYSTLGYAAPLAYRNYLW